jgi:hypothetical protein
MSTSVPWAKSMQKKWPPRKLRLESSQLLQKKSGHCQVIPRPIKGISIMGKVTGFMEFERLEEGYKPVQSV